METLPSGERQGRYLPLLEIIEGCQFHYETNPISVIGVCHRLNGCFAQLLK